MGGDWDWSKFEPFLPADIVLHVQAVLPPSTDAEDDCPFWAPSSSGNFSVRTAYASLQVSVDNDRRLPWARLWKWVGPQRIKVFMWLLLNNEVMTNVERNRRHVSSMTRCQVCNIADESSLHLIRDCHFAISVWERIIIDEQSIWFFSTDMSLSDWLFRNLVEQKHHKFPMDWNIVFGVTIWFLWKRRNRFVLGDDSQSPAFSAEILVAAIMREAQHIVAAADLLP